MIFLLFTFGVLAFVFYHWQYFMVFSPTYHREESLGEEFEGLSIISQDNIELEGIVYEPKELYRKLPSIDARKDACSFSPQLVASACPKGPV